MRLRRLEEEFGDALQVEWRSFLLRPRPGSSRTLEQFRTYTHSWMRPAAEPDSGTFRVWVGEAGPPTHSVPPHVVAKAAATLGGDAFRRVHRALLHAYFAESRDITNADTLAAVWHEAALPDDQLVRAADPAFIRETLAQHEEAVELGVTGVPAVMLVGLDVPVLGALPLETYRRWIRRTLSG